MSQTILHHGNVPAEHVAVNYDTTVCRSRYYPLESTILTGMAIGLFQCHWTRKDLQHMYTYEYMVPCCVCVCMCVITNNRLEFQLFLTLSCIVHS